MSETMIDHPGAFDVIPGATYHGQLTPTPSMSAGMAIEIMDSCPAKMWGDSYLNPKYEATQKREFDLGTAGHVALLEPGDWSERIVVVDADSYRTNAAKDARDKAYGAGKTPLLPQQLDQIEGVRQAVLADPVAGKAFVGGKSEQTVVCRDPKTGIWQKCRPDKAPLDWSWLADVKITTSANPRQLKKKAHEDGWAQRAEWYLDVVERAVGTRPETYFFIVAEIKPPHLVTVCRYRPRLGEKPRALEWAAMMNRKAIDLFAACLAADSWPTYAQHVVDLDLPTYAEYQLEDRRAEGEFETKPTAALLRRAMDFQKPVNRGA